MRRPFLIAAALAVSAMSAAGGAGDGDVIALVGGEVRTAAGPVLRDATVVVGGGKILAVGEGVVVPDGARRIDVKGAVVTPGFLDADGSLPIADGERYAPRWGLDLCAADAVNAFDARYATARSQGVTGFVVTGDLRGNFPCALAVVAAERTAIVVERDGPIAVTLATADVAGGLWGAQRLAEIRNVFVDARERRDLLARWRRDLQRFEDRRAAETPLAVERLLLPPGLVDEMAQWTPERRAAWREAALKSAGREKDWTKPKDVAKPPVRPASDPALDLLLTAMEGPSGRRTWIRTQCAADVASALALAREFGLAATIAGGEGLAASAAELVKAKVPVVITDCADTDARSDGPLASRAPGLAARLAAAGLRPAIGSGGVGGNARFLRLFAARAISEGLSPDDALRAVTAWPAEAAGVAGRVGTLTAGARADVVVWDGDPFDAATRPRVVIVGGEIVDGGAK